MLQKSIKWHFFFFCDNLQIIEVDENSKMEFSVQEIFKYNDDILIMIPSKLVDKLMKFFG